MAPYDIASHIGVWAENLSYIGVGFCFGFILERAGFGDSRKLAGQFYLHDMTVLKVMFTAIIVAMVLTYWGVALQLVDLSRVFINPTYLGSGILGGLLLGLGFIMGGYCPGTALVASATLKLDGMFFLAGVLVGTIVFGEAAPLVWGFYQQTGYLGRYSLPDWLGLDAGLVVLLVVLMALAMFTAGEALERLTRAKRAAEAAALAAQSPGVTAANAGEAE